MSTDTASTLLEDLASLAHDQWAGWMRYLFSKCMTEPGLGSVVIPPHLVERWKRQLSTPYAELPENEKESDRKEAWRVLEVVRRHREANLV